MAGRPCRHEGPCAPKQWRALFAHGDRCLSKFAWVVPVKSKDGAAVSAAFREILEVSAPRHPRRLQTDKGNEFFNTSFSNLMRRHDIQHFASESDQKAAVVERFNRTIQTRLWTYMSDRGTVRYLDVLAQLVDSYNHSRHRSIGMVPAEVREHNQDRIWAKLYRNCDTESKQQSIPTGAMVRINKSKGVSDNGYMPNWSKENFTVAAAPPNRKLSRRMVYKLINYNDEPVTGSWYDDERRHISDNQY